MCIHMHTHACSDVCIYVSALGVSISLQAPYISEMSLQQGLIQFFSDNRLETCPLLVSFPSLTLFHTRLPKLSGITSK